MARRGRPPRPGGRPGRKRRKPRDRNVAPARPQVPDTEIAKLEEQTRLDVGRLMTHLRQDLGLLEEERLLARILEQHPEHQEAFEKAADHLSMGDPSSPFVHVALHRIVEQRVVTRELGSEMTRFSRDKPWHEAVHEAAEQVAAEMFVDDEAEEPEQASTR